MNKCDFCDISLKTDLDVSKHLVSQNHLKNLSAFNALQPQDQAAERNTPKNIGQVFEILKVRSVADLRELADKNFFRIPKDNENLLGVVDEIVEILMKNVSDNITRDLATVDKRTIMGAFNLKVEDQPVTLASSQPVKPPLGQQMSQASSPPEPTTSFSFKDPAPQHVPIPLVRPRIQRLPATVSESSSANDNQVASSEARSKQSRKQTQSQSIPQIGIQLHSHLPTRIHPPSQTAPHTTSQAVAQVATQVQRQAENISARSQSAIRPPTQVQRPPMNFLPGQPCITITLPMQAQTNLSNTPVQLRPAVPPNAIPNNGPRVPISSDRDESPRPHEFTNYKPMLAKIKVEPKE